MKTVSNQSVGTLSYQGAEVYYAWVADTNGAYNDSLASAMQDFHVIASGMVDPKFMGAYPTDKLEYNEYIILYDTHVLMSVDTEELYELIMRA